MLLLVRGFVLQRRVLYLLVVLLSYHVLGVLVLFLVLFFVVLF